MKSASDHHGVTTMTPDTERPLAEPMNSQQPNKQQWTIPIRWGLTATTLIILALVVSILNYLDGMTGPLQVAGIIGAAIALLLIGPLTIYTLVKASRDRAK